MGHTPFEALYGRPFLQKDLILDLEVTNLFSHITQLANFQQVLSEVGREEPKASPQLIRTKSTWRFSPYQTPP
jgi:hypothetical protein